MKLYQRFAQELKPGRTFDRLLERCLLVAVDHLRSTRLAPSSDWIDNMLDVIALEEFGSGLSPSRISPPDSDELAHLRALVPRLAHELSSPWLRERLDLLAIVGGRPAAHTLGSHPGLRWLCRADSPIHAVIAPQSADVIELVRWIDGDFGAARDEIQRFAREKNRYPRSDDPSRMHLVGCIVQLDRRPITTFELTGEACW